jgi:catalase
MRGHRVSHWKRVGMEHEDGWREIFDGGSPEAEREIFLTLAEDMVRVQETNRQKAAAAQPSRTLHAKAVVGVTNAILLLDDTLPTDFRAGPYQPGAALPAIVRLSNASGVAQSDAAPDMRGAALRIGMPEGGVHDLLMTSFPASHARDARQFVAFAVIASGPRETLQARLIEAFGETEARRMAANIGQGVRPCSSFALESFWSRGAVLWGDAPVRFQLRPEPGAAAPAAADPSSDPAEALRAEFSARLRRGPVKFRLALQRFIDEEQTPIEDGTADWERTSPRVEIATLIVPQQDLMGDEGQRQAAEVEGFAFNPWNAPAAFRPLGNLNRARAVVYSLSAARWGGLSPAPGMSTSADLEGR